MASNVVLGDLSLLRADDTLKFDGVDDNVQIGIVDIYTPQVDTLTVDLCVRTAKTGNTAGTVYCIGAPSTSSLRTFQVYILSNRLEIYVGGVFTQSKMLNADTYYDIVVSVPASASGVNVWVNSTLETTGGGVGTGSSTRYCEIGSRTQGTGFLYNSEICGVSVYRNYITDLSQDKGEVLQAYIKNGDFGSSTLIDHSGNGNDGTINGAQWWKRGIDEVYSTPDLYLSTLPVTPVEFQYVTYTDAVPYHPTGAAYWGNYDENWMEVGGEITSYNSVVLGDLSLLRADDALRFFSGYCTLTAPSTSPDSFGACTIVSDVVFDEVASVQVLHAQGTSAYRSYINSGVLTINGASTTNFTAVAGVSYKIEVDYNSSGEGIAIRVNGSAYTITGGTAPVGNSSASSTFYVGTRDNLSLILQGVLTGFEITGFGSYIQNGDFGSPTLIDHSGNGNDGTINGAKWWKRNVDEVYSTPDLYLSTLPVTPEEFQYVTYTDAEPYYPTNDPYWGNYNETWLVVSKQSTGVSTGTVGFNNLKFGLYLY
jgi:hypothetical protein